MSLNPARTIAELKELRALTADDNGAQRVAWTPLWMKTREWFAQKLVDLPVEHHLDAAGNRWITLRGESPKTLILGSHLDSVPNGGWLDGALGVMTGLEILRRFNTNTPAARQSPFVWSISPMKKVPASVAACSVRRPSPEPIPSPPTAAAQIKTVSVWKMPCASAASKLTVSPKPPSSAKTPRLTWSCISSRGRYSKPSVYRSASCSAPRAWRGTPLLSTARKPTPVPLP